MPQPNAPPTHSLVRPLVVLIGWWANELAAFTDAGLVIRRPNSRCVCVMCIAAELRENLAQPRNLGGSLFESEVYQTEGVTSWIVNAELLLVQMGPLVRGSQIQEKLVLTKIRR